MNATEHYFPLVTFYYVVQGVTIQVKAIEKYTYFPSVLFIML